MTEKREVVIIGGGSYGRPLSKLIANAFIGTCFTVVEIEAVNPEIKGTKYDKVYFDELYNFDSPFNRFEPVAAYDDYHQPKSQKPWKTGYIPQHNAGPSYSPSALLLSLVDRVK